MSTATVEAAYWTLRPEVPIARTVEVSPTVLVDVDTDGRVVGVERLDGLVDAGTLAEVLREVRL